MHLLLILAVIYQTGFCATEEPKCTSQFDYEHRLLYKLIKIEEDVKDFRNFVKKLKASQAQDEIEQNQKLENVLNDFKNTAGVQFKETAEQSEKLLKQIKESLDNFNKTFQNVQNHVEETVENFQKQYRRSAIGFSVTDPTAGDSPTNITFNTTITNTGDSFDESTGRFTCQTPGYYYFTVALLKQYYHSGSSYCSVYKNDEVLVDVYVRPSYSSGGYRQSGSYGAVNSVFINLDKGDTVFLGECSKLASMDSRSSFSGFLVTAD